MDTATIALGSALQDGGVGIRFTVTDGSQELSAFAVRHRGRVYAYLNRCGHLDLELDWLPGQFLSADGNDLVCATHGARYDPANGACLGGPCAGTGLTPVAVVELDGVIRLADNGPYNLQSIDTGAET